MTKIILIVLLILFFIHLKNCSNLEIIFIQVLDATINTKLDCNQIDLNEYLNVNGVERTIYNQ